MKSKSSKGMVRLAPVAALLFCLLISMPQPNLANPILPPGVLAMAGIQPPAGFRRSGITVNSPTNRWFAVPDWLAGTWEAKSQTIIEAYDYRQQAESIDSPVNLNVKRTTVIGMQRDKTGCIWHFAGTPYDRLIETDSMLVKQKINALDLVKSDEEGITVNTMAEITRFSKKTNQVIDNLLEKTTTTYLPLGADLIQVSFAITDYDTSGNAVSSSHDVCIAKRIAPYKAVNFDDRGNLQLMFQQCMRANGMSDLVPGL